LSPGKDFLGAGTGTVPGLKTKQDRLDQYKRAFLKSGDSYDLTVSNLSETSDDFALISASMRNLSPMYAPSHDAAIVHRIQSTLNNAYASRIEDLTMLDISEEERANMASGIAAATRTQVLSGNRLYNYNLSGESLAQASATLLKSGVLDEFSPEAQKA